MATDNKRILIRIDVVEKNASVNIDKTRKSVDQLAESTSKLNTRTSKGNATAGLNNAILLETSRLASDASYGFQGMANNLGQVVQLLSISAENSGGFGKALKDVGSQILGFGGVMIGIQLLISFLPNLEKLFKKLTRSIDPFNDVLEKSIEFASKSRSEFDTLTNVLLDASESTEQKRIALERLNEDYPDFNANVLKDAENHKEATKAIDDYIKKLDEKARSQAAEALKEQEYALLIESQLELERISREEGYENYAALVKKRENIDKKQSEISSIRAKTRLSDEANLLLSETKSAEKSIAKSQERIDALDEFIILENKASKKSSAERNKTFTEGLFDLSKFILQYRKQANKIFIQSEQERIDLEEDFAKQEADRRLRVFIDSQKKRLEEYKERVKGRKDGNKLIANAEIEFNNSIEDARVKHGEALLTIEDSYITERILLADKQGRLRAESERKIEDLEIKSLKSRIDANQTYYDQKINQITEDLKLDRIRLNTTELNLKDELALRESIAKQQILLEDLKLKAKVDSINEQKRIDLQYISFAQGIGGMLSTLAGENEALQKAALIVEKGAAIASIIIKTQSSNAVLRATASASAPPPANIPFIALAEAQAARNNIGAGISIASILATTLTSFNKTSGGRSGGAGGNVEVEAPDFNIVGASSESQLAQSIGGQQSKPIKAFVVGKEITTQQELDRNTINTAGLGG
jgi:hypothetical protein